MDPDAGALPVSRRSPLPFSINIEGGAGALVLPARSLSALGRIEQLRMDVPGLRFPFDLSGGAGGFRNRRCDLRRCELSVSSGELRRFLDAGPMQRLGVSRVTVELGAPAFSLLVSVTTARGEVELAAAGMLRVAGGRRLRVALHELRAFGVLPVPAPVVACAVLRGASAGLGALARLGGPTELEADVLDAALYDLLPGRGFRLPARAHLRLAAPTMEGDRLVLRFAPASPGVEPDDPDDGFAFSDPSTRSGWFGAYEEGRALFPEGEEALREGDVARATEIYRRAVAIHPGSAFLTGRLLHLLSAGPETLAEAEELASALLATRPRLVPALLVRAAAAGAAGRAAEAAELYRLVAEECAPLPALETAAALRAAAGWHLEVGQLEAARDLLERVRAHAPGHVGTLDLLRRCYRAQGRHADWLAVLRQQELDEPDVRRRSRLVGEAARVLLEEMDQPGLAGERFAEAIVLDESVMSLWEGLGQAQARLGELAAARGSFERALSLAEAAADGEAVARVLLALGGVLERLGDHAGAESCFARAQAAGAAEAGLVSRRSRALSAQGRADDAVSLLESAIAAAGDPSAVADLRVELSELLARNPEARARARVELERVLSEFPAHTRALQQLVALSDPRGAGELLAVFRRALERAEDAAVARQIIESARAIATQAGQPDFVVDALLGSARAATRAGAEAARQLARLLLDGELGEASVRVGEELRAVVERHLASPAIATLPVRADLARLLAALHEHAGDEEAALAALERCLALDAPAEVAVAAWRRVVELKARRGDAAGAARALIASADDPRTAQPAPARAALLVAAAEILRERLQLPNDALPLLERATILDPLNSKAFDALEVSAEAAEDWPRLVEVISRRAERARLTERRTQLGRMARVLSERLGRDEEAAQAYRRALEIDPEYVPALVWLARHAWQLGDTAESVALYRRLAGIRTRPGAPAGATPEQYSEAHLRMAQIARVLGQSGDAERHLERGLANEPEHGAPLDVLCDALEGLGELELLAGSLRARVEAETRTPIRRELQFALARVLEQSGHAAQAAAIYGAMVAASPDDVEALGHLAELHRRESQWREVAAVLERLLALADSHPDVIDRGAVIVDLARALSQSGADLVRAEELLRAELARDPRAREAAEALGRLLLQRGAWQEADRVLEAAGVIRRGQAPGATPGADMAARQDATADAASAVTVARARLDAGAGEVAAYAVLRPFVLERLPSEGLALRGLLAGKLGDLDDLAAVLARWQRLPAPPAERDGAASDRDGPDGAGGATGAERERWWQSALALSEAGLSHRETWEAGMALLEQVVERRPRDREAIERLAAQYAGMDDPRARGRPLALLTEHGAAGGERVFALAEKLAGLAESEGDLASAERTLAGALALEVSPAARVRGLAARARLCCALGDPETASADLREALAIDPAYAPALALYGELAYRAADWAEARRAYAALAGLAGAPEHVDPVLLAFRRAELAETFGDEAEAERCYRQVIELVPDHGPAREALAGYATFRGQHAEAADWLEGALGTALVREPARAGELRERLARACLEAGAFARARAHLEDLLAESPDRVSALELYADALIGAGEPARAAELWGRLSRLHGEERKRAEALYRQGEILRERLGDRDAADDAYLRASDIDPGFAPPLLRLVEYFFRRGDLPGVLDVARDLARLADGPASLAAGPAGWLVAFAVVLSGAERASVPVVRAEAHARPALQALLDVTFAWADAPSDAATALIELFAERLGEPAALAMLRDDAGRRLAADPQARTPAALALLARVLELTGDSSRARVALAVRALRLRRAGEASAAVAGAPRGALRVDDAVLSSELLVHPGCQHPARRVLAALAPALAGLGARAPATAGDEAEPDADQAALFQGLLARLGAPQADLRIVAHERGAGAPHRAVALRPGLPPVVLLDAEAGRGSPGEVAFHLACGLEELRSGVFLLDRFPELAMSDLFAVLAAALRGELAQEQGRGDGRAEDGGPAFRRVLAAYLAQPAAARLMPEHATRERLFDDALEAAATPPDRGAFRSACAHTAHRLAALLCGDPHLALELTRREAGAEAAEELASFLLSEAYAGLVSSPRG